VIVTLCLVSLGLFWLPFFFKIENFLGINFDQQNMETIVANFDGLNFLVIAKSWYDPNIIEQINAQFLTGNDPIYFSAHFPFFPGLIRFFDLFLTLPHSLLAAIVLVNIVFGMGLYWFFETVNKDRKLAILLTSICLFFPARMLSVRGVGSNEPLFIFFVVTSLTWMIKGKYWASALMGALAVLTRSPGILLFFVYFIAFTKKLKLFYPFLLMPLAIIGLFAYYGWQYQDPLAYFHSGDNIHLFFPPFQIFSNTASWISDMWREDIVYLYLFYGLGLLMVNSKWQLVKNWGLLYGATLLFVAHRDLARYALPIAPIALLGYAPLLKKIPQRVWYLLLILLIPIYLFSWQFVLKNIQPINDWRVFL